MGQTASVTDLQAYRSAREAKSSSVDPMKGIEIRIQTIEEKLGIAAAGSERITPEAMYKDVTDDAISSTILKARAILKQCLSYLDDALKSYDQEIERENQIEVSLGIFQTLDYIGGLDTDFRDAITLVQLATTGHRIRPYARKELVTLRHVLTVMRDNIRMRSGSLDDLIGLLDGAGFDISGPLRGMELDDLT